MSAALHILSLLREDGAYLPHTGDTDYAEILAHTLSRTRPALLLGAECAEEQAAYARVAEAAEVTPEGVAAAYAEVYDGAQALTHPSRRRRLPSA